MMRTILRLIIPAAVAALAGVLAVQAQPGYDLLACAIRSRDWAPGRKLESAGLLVRWAGGQWGQRGAPHMLIETLDYDPRDPRVLYLAGGDGCLRSRDSGHTWVITTDETMTELRDLSVDPQQPDHVYIALPDGVAVTRDQGTSWRRLELGVPRPFTKTIRVDRTRAGRVLAGTEQALLLSEDAGGTWRAVARGDLITDLAQSPHDPQWWVATLQRGGLLESHDGGRSWRKVDGVPGDRTLYNAAFDPHRPGAVAVAAWEAGVLVSEDGGRTWTARNEGLPSLRVWRVAYDPGVPGRLFTALWEEAVYLSEDGGRHWRRDGLEGSMVYDLVFVPRARPGLPRPDAFRDRVRQVVEHYANPPDPTATSYQHVAAKLWLRRDVEWASRRLVELLRDPQGDMFWMFQVTAIAFLGRETLSAEAQAALRHAWKTYHAFRGDTENHWLLYYTSLYLMTQLWPDLPGEAWFNGKDSQTNHREAERWIRRWMEITLDDGQGEYDSTHYMGLYLFSMSYLAEWAADADMRQRARMMLEWLMADYAAESLDGLHAGAHARTDDRSVLEKWYAVSSDFGWLWFGLGYPLPGYSYPVFYYAVSAALPPPEVIDRIATDRSQPYTHREIQRSRNRWRFYDGRSAPVYKTTYVCRDYAVGSDQGGVFQPVQQHSWDVTWRVDDPRGVHNTLFALHPHFDVRDLQAFYTRAPDLLVEYFRRFRPSYDSPDKFLGGSPYEQILQDRDTLIALYNIPPEAPWPHVNGFFSKDLSRIEEHPSGWIFCEGGRAYIAYRPLAPYEWRPIDYHDWLPAAEGGRRLYSPRAKNGAIVQVASAGEFADFRAFEQAVAALPLEVKLEPVPSVRFRSLRGADLKFTWGEPRDWSGWKRFDSPYVESERGSRTLVLRHGEIRRVLDFRSLRVTEERAGKR
jgi:photosystem II stability/assembly factor-like uncharacterized protein